MTTLQQIEEQREAIRIRRAAIVEAGKARSKRANTYMTREERRAVEELIGAQMGEEMGTRVYDQLTAWEGLHAAAEELETLKRAPAKTPAEKLDEVKQFIEELEESYRDLDAETREY